MELEGEDAYLTGFTASPNFPVTTNAYDQTFNRGIGEAFMAKLDTGRAPPAEYLNTSAATQLDVGLTIDVEGSDAFVSGTSLVPQFPGDRKRL